eukprot:997818-Rhodomonas_salina.1
MSGRWRCGRARGCCVRAPRKWRPRATSSGLVGGEGWWARVWSRACLRCARAWRSSRCRRIAARMRAGARRRCAGR